MVPRAFSAARRKRISFAILALSAAALVVRHRPIERLSLPVWPRWVRGSNISHQTAAGAFALAATATNKLRDRAQRSTTAAAAAANRPPNPPPFDANV